MSKVSLSDVNAALNRLKNCLPRGSLDALYGVAELVQTPEFETGTVLLVIFTGVFRNFYLSISKSLYRSGYVK